MSGKIGRFIIDVIVTKHEVLFPYLAFDGSALVVVHDQGLQALLVQGGAAVPLGSRHTIASQHEKQSDYDETKGSEVNKPVCIRGFTGASVNLDLSRE